jgi:hypothetical protein
MKLYYIKPCYTPNPCGSGFTHESGNTLLELDHKDVPKVEALGFSVEYTDHGNHPFVNSLTKENVNTLLQHGAEWG